MLTGSDPPNDKNVNIAYKPGLLDKSNFIPHTDVEPVS